ncbi:Hypothetical predicted protein, partial [Marmota monax]
TRFPPPMSGPHASVPFLPPSLQATPSLPLRPTQDALASTHPGPHASSRPPSRGRSGCRSNGPDACPAPRGQCRDPGGGRFRALLEGTSMGRELGEYS